jgi:hypothetical protein
MSDFIQIGGELEDAVEAALDQIVSDVKVGDLTAIEELLRYVPLEVLRGFVSEVNYDYDGQPDEAQEWHDFDPEC